ncbi:hypothetical protein RUND412_011355, partial [Rhizina undulata]
MTTTATKRRTKRMPNRDPDPEDITTLHVISSSQISKKVDRVLKALYEGGPTAVVALQATAKVAVKAISITEIAKRRIAEDGRRWFHYCCLWDAEYLEDEAGEGSEVKGKGKVKQKGVDEKNNKETEKEEEEDPLKAPEEYKGPGKRKREPTRHKSAKKRILEVEDGEEEDPFEALQEDDLRTVKGRREATKWKRPAKRLAPVMTIYISLYRIHTFVKRYG